MIRPSRPQLRCLLISLAALPIFFLRLKTMPHGFPPDHPRFWINTALPVVFFLAVSLGIFLPLFTSRRISPFSSALPGLILGMCVACVLLFPVSMRNRFHLLTLVLLAYTLFAWWRWVRAHPPEKTFYFLGILSFAAGGFWAWGQRAPTASTRPLAAEIPAAFAVEAEPGSASLSYRQGDFSLILQPGLYFESFSPDRFWTLFTPDYFPDADMQQMTLKSDPLNLTVWTEFPQTFWTHLNGFTSANFSGSVPLSISFSPIPRQRFELPVQRNAQPNVIRLACLDADGTFRVLETRVRDKGPFQELARGNHNREDPLLITLYQGSQPGFTLKFDDFTRQCSTELSPTGGWNFPQNAIEFASIANDPTRGYIFMTLAATSVGTGWDSVGHQAGAYRNRIQVTLHRPEESPQ